MCIFLVNEILQRSPQRTSSRSRQASAPFYPDNPFLPTLIVFSFFNSYLFYYFLCHIPERNQSAFRPQRTGICHQNLPPEIACLFFLLYIRGLQHCGYSKPFPLLKYSPISLRSVLGDTAWEFHENRKMNVAFHCNQ